MLNSGEEGADDNRPIRSPAAELILTADRAAADKNGSVPDVVERKRHFKMMTVSDVGVSQ